MTKEQMDEAAACITHIRDGLESGVSELNRRFAIVALDRLSVLIANGHTAASHGKPKRGRRKKAAEPPPEATA